MRNRTTMRYRSLVRAGFRKGLSWAVIASLGALAITRVIDLDTPWHLRTGELLLRTHALPAQDPFSYTSSHPWLVHEWLSEVLLGLTFRAAGWTGLAMLQAFSVAATLAAIWWSAQDDADDVASDRGWRFVAQIAPLAMLAVILREALAPRATVFSIPLFAWMLALCVRLVRGLPARWWLLPACGLLLTQLHGGNPEGVALAGLVALATRKPKWFALSIAMAFLTLAGPYGWRVHTHFLHADTRPIREWQPLAVLLEHGSHAYYLVPLSMLLAVAALAAQQRDPSPPSSAWRLFAWLALALWSALTLRFLRFAPQVSIVATAVFLPWWRDRVRNSIRWRVPLGAIAWWFFACAALASTDRAPGVGPLPGRFPEGAVAWLRVNQPAGPMFNSYNFGGYLLWAWPRERVFIDGRHVTVYSPEHLASLEAVYRNPDRFRDMERRWRFRLAVVQRAGAGHGLYLWLLANPAWHVRYEDRLAAVLTRDPLP